MISWQQAMDAAIKAAEEADQYARVEWTSDSVPVLTEAATRRAQSWTAIAIEIRRMETTRSTDERTSPPLRMDLDHIDGAYAVG